MAVGTNQTAGEPEPTRRRDTAHGPGAADYGLLFVLASLWGASFLLIKIAVDDVPPLTLTLLRLAFAAAVMWCALVLTGARLPTNRQAWKLIVAAATIGTVLPFILVSWGQSGIDSGLTAILMGVMPLITMVIAHFSLPDDKLNGAKLAGVLCGLIGIVVLMGPEKLLALGDGLKYQLAIIGTATCFSIGAVLMRKWMGDASQVGLATAIMSLSFLIMIPIVMIFEGLPSELPPLKPLTAIAVLGIVQTGFAQLFLFALVARQGPSFFSQINFIVPLMGVGWGAAILGERLPVAAFVALALILAGLAISRFGNRRN
jgi:drug/metabolite transporter (DMT)-like permease